MANDKPNTLLELARKIAASNTRFHDVLGPGAGDHATRDFMHRLRKDAERAFGRDFRERKICGKSSLAVDFYFPNAGTIVEVALGLPNPATEFEKDILKAIMAQESGHHVRKLFFISRAGQLRNAPSQGGHPLKSGHAQSINC